MVVAPAPLAGSADRIGASGTVVNLGGGWLAVAYRLHKSCQPVVDPLGWAAERICRARSFGCDSLAHYAASPGGNHDASAGGRRLGSHCRELGSFAAASIWAC